jgi:Fic family protein
MSKYIYQKPEWPQFHWNDEKLTALLASIRNKPKPNWKL